MFDGFINFEHAFANSFLVILSPVYIVVDVVVIAASGKIVTKF